MSRGQSVQLAGLSGSQDVVSQQERRIDLRNPLVAGTAVLAMLFGWHWWNVPRDTRTPEAMVAEYLLVVGLSALILTLWFRFHESVELPQIDGWLLDSAVAAGLAAMIWFLGMRQFGGYDHSAMIQSGWLQLSTLVPFKDYPCTLPPLFFLGAKYAFLIFGLRWSAFVGLMAIFAVLSFYVLSKQLRALGFSAGTATGLTLAAELGTCVVCSYWWYNPVTSVVAVITLLSTLVYLQSPSEWAPWALLAGALTLLLLSKPNAWPMGACAGVVCVTRDTRLRIRGLALFAASALSSALICWINGLNPVRLLRTYSQIAETRGHPFHMIGLIDASPLELSIWLKSTAVILLMFLALLVINRNELRPNWREYLCCAVAGVTSLSMASMNYEIKTTDLVPLVVALAIVAFRPWSKRRFDGFGRWATVTVTVVFVVLSSYWAVTRMRVRGIGERTFFETAPEQTIPSGFFAGLHSGPRLVSVLQQVDNALRRYPSTHVFFGPRMEFSYAAFRREPPRGLPIWWHAGSSFAVSDMAGVLHALDNDDFDMMVFLKNDRTRVPVVALQHKLSSYDLIGGFSELDVYVRRKASGQS